MTTFGLAALVVISAAISPHFKYERTVELDNTVIIGSVDKLAIGPDGEFLVTDYAARQVMLFDSSGALLARLDPAECHPGFTMSPIDAFFTSARIFLVNSGPWGFLFDQRGQCMVPPHDSFRAMPLLSWDGKNIIYGYSGRDQITIMDAHGRSIRSVSLPGSAKARFPEIEQRVLGGGLVANSASLFFARVSDYRIIKIDVERTGLQSFGRQPRQYTSIQSDLPSAVSDRLFESIRRLMADRTITTSLLALSEDLLMIQFKHGLQGRGYQIWTTRGDLIAEHHDSIKDHRFFDQLHNGSAYRVVQPEPTDSGVLPNPVIQVYSFVES